MKFISTLAIALGLVPFIAAAVAPVENMVGLAEVAFEGDYGYGKKGLGYGKKGDYGKKGYYGKKGDYGKKDLTSRELPGVRREFLDRCSSHPSNPAPMYKRSCHRSPPFHPINLSCIPSPSHLPSSQSPEATIMKVISTLAIALGLVPFIAAAVAPVEGMAEVAFEGDYGYGGYGKKGLGYGKKGDYGKKGLGYGKKGLGYGKKGLGYGKKGLGYGKGFGYGKKE
ncbi:hypothetical protein BDK51DRAFT_33036, partial [Blyttiomyces helicus]